jgi:predicted AAA+ superfamily ATPase
VDPALAARLLGATHQSLLDDTVPNPIPRQGTLLGSLFESLAVMTARVYAELSGARVSHLRTHNGDQEVDLIVERDDHCVLAIEVKLAGAATANDTKHLSWLAREIGNRLIDRVVITTGRFAHRLPDGTAVIPLGLLGP